MKKVIVLVINIVLSLIVLTGCLANNKITNDNREQVDFTKHYSFNVVSINNENIYFINEDDKLCITKDGFSNVEVYMNVKMQLFAFTEKYLLYVDMIDKLHIVNQSDKSEKVYDWNADKTIRTSIGFTYITFSDSVIFEDRIVYRTKEKHHLVSVFLDNLEEEIISEKETMNLTYYGDKIVYSIRQDKFFKPYILELYSPSDNSFKAIGEHYVYRMRSKGDYIYYINKYSLYRLSMVTGERECIYFDSSIFNFQVSDSKALYKSSEGLIVSDLDGSNGVLLEENDGYPVDVANDTFLYFLSEESSYVIFNDNEKIRIKNDSNTLNRIFINDLLFMRFGTSETPGRADEVEIDVDKILVYDLDGNIVYENR